MTLNLENLWQIFLSGKVIWSLCGGALLCILVDSLWPKRMTSLVFGVALLSLIFSLILAFDQWLHPETLGNQDLLVIDRLTLFFLILVIVIAIFTLLNALGYLRLHENLTAEFSSLILLSVVGMVFLFASDHLILNFIGLETMSLAVYVLVGSHKKNTKSNEAAVKYYILGSVASAILLYGIALFYGAFGTLKLSQLAYVVSAPELAYLPKIALGLILTGLFFKLAIVPFHFWAPDVYQGAPAPVTGFMATGVKAAALGFGLRVFLELGTMNLPQIQVLLQWVIVATFLVGNLVAIAQDDVKRMLAYSSIAHAGFLIFGLLAGFENGVYQRENSSSVLFYLLGYSFMTLGAFAFLSLLVQEKKEATSFGDLSGLGHTHPILAAVFGLFMLSLLGLPGTVGFAVKYNVIALAVKNGHIALSIVAVLTSVISAFYYLRPISVMYFRESSSAAVIQEIPLTLYVSLTVCAFAVIYLGLQPDLYLEFSKIAVSVFS